MNRLIRHRLRAANAFALQVENQAQALDKLLQQALWQGKGTPVSV
jgi:hypothetical protein